MKQINTNKSFLISVLQNKSFENAVYNTKFIENNLLVEKKNNKELFEKILDNSIYKLYFSIYKILDMVLCENAKKSLSDLILSGS